MCCQTANKKRKAHERARTPDTFHAAVAHLALLLGGAWVELTHRMHHLNGHARVLAEEMQRQVAKLRTKSARRAYMREDAPADIVTSRVAVAHRVLLLGGVWVELKHRAHHLDGHARVLAEDMQRCVAELRTKSARCA